MDPIVRVERRSRVLEMTLDHPKVNAVSRRLSRELYAAARLLHEDPELQAGLITGAGTRAFSAGWDFNEAVADADAGNAALENQPGGEESGASFGGITAFHDLYKPLIAAVQAPAIGGGFEIALACDMILMAEDAFFQLPEMDRGILPDAGGLQRLPRRIPYNVAMGMMLTGRRMDAAEALHWGLVHSVHPRDELLDAARDLAGTISQGAPLALQALKEVMLAIEQMPLPEAMDIIRKTPDHLAMYRRMLKSGDAKEGPRAYLEKRAPVWRGE
ncbi:crotonobetainyl-CoA hydratase [Rhodoligotrophos appendicifer]|uniref:enoyl-CoA hydratase-related protein n=1 Tax=Rhodoligotrophos appendicifer TaxID=987056 RepID=UPI001184D1BC|nr:enoyl-CoA hydratase-related protein [Rhodoligotrophos appendicifer]